MQINSINSSINKCTFSQNEQKKDNSLIFSAIPGCHQFINGRAREGFVFSSAFSGLAIFAFYLDKSIKRDLIKGFAAKVKQDEPSKLKAINSLKAKKSLVYATGASAICVAILNLIDAYKHTAKKQ